MEHTWTHMPRSSPEFSSRYFTRHYIHRPLDQRNLRHGLKGRRDKFCTGISLGKSLRSLVNIKDTFVQSVNYWRAETCRDSSLKVENNPRKNGIYCDCSNFSQQTNGHWADTDRQAEKQSTTCTWNAQAQGNVPFWILLSNSSKRPVMLPKWC